MVDSHLNLKSLLHEISLMNNSTADNYNDGMIGTNLLKSRTDEGAGPPPSPPPASGCFPCFTCSGIVGKLDTEFSAVRRRIFLTSPENDHEAEEEGQSPAVIETNQTLPVFIYQTQNSPSPDSDSDSDSSSEWEELEEGSQEESLPASKHLHLSTGEGEHLSVSDYLPDEHDVFSPVSARQSPSIVIEFIDDNKLVHSTDQGEEVEGGTEEQSYSPDEGSTSLQEVEASIDDEVEDKDNICSNTVGNQEEVPQQDMNLKKLCGDEIKELEDFFNCSEDKTDEEADRETNEDEIEGNDDEDQVNIFTSDSDLIEFIDEQLRRISSVEEKSKQDEAAKEPINTVDTGSASVIDTVQIDEAQDDFETGEASEDDVEKEACEELSRKEIEHVDDATGETKMDSEIVDDPVPMNNAVSLQPENDSFTDSVDADELQPVKSKEILNESSCESLANAPIDESDNSVIATPKEPPTLMKNSNDESKPVEAEEISSYFPITEQVKEEMKAFSSPLEREFSPNEVIEESTVSSVPDEIIKKDVCSEIEAEPVEVADTENKEVATVEKQVEMKVNNSQFLSAEVDETETEFVSSGPIFTPPEGDSSPLLSNATVEVNEKCREWVNSTSTCDVDMDNGEINSQDELEDELSGELERGDKADDLEITFKMLQDRMAQLGINTKASNSNSESSEDSEKPEDLEESTNEPEPLEEELIVASDPPQQPSCESGFSKDNETPSKEDDPDFSEVLANPSVTEFQVNSGTEDVVVHLETKKGRLVLPMDATALSDIELEMNDIDLVSALNQQNQTTNHAESPSLLLPDVELLSGLGIAKSFKRKLSLEDPSYTESVPQEGDSGYAPSSAPTTPRDLVKSRGRDGVPTVFGLDEVEMEN